MFDFSQIGLPRKVVDRDGIAWLALYRVHSYNDIPRTLYLAVPFDANLPNQVSAVLIFDDVPEVG